MAEKKTWSKEETEALIGAYESFPEIWDCRHKDYKDREKRSMCWQSIGKVTSTSVAEVQRKVHNLRNQVSKYSTYCTTCIVFFVWIGPFLLYIALCTWTCKLSCQVCLCVVMYVGPVLGFHFSVRTELCAVKFQMQHTVAHVSCNWSTIFILALYGKVMWSKMKHLVVCWVISIVNLRQK
jgi:hypothetical protein